MVAMVRVLGRQRPAARYLAVAAGRCFHPNGGSRLLLLRVFCLSTFRSQLVPEGLSPLMTHVPCEGFVAAAVRGRRQLVLQPAPRPTPCCPSSLLRLHYHASSPIATILPSRSSCGSRLAAAARCAPPPFRHPRASRQRSQTRKNLNSRPPRLRSQPTARRIEGVST